MLGKSGILSTNRELLRQFIHPDVAKNTPPLKDGMDFIRFSSYLRYLKEEEIAKTSVNLKDSYTTSLEAILKNYNLAEKSFQFLKILHVCIKEKVFSSVRKFIVVFF